MLSRDLHLRRFSNTRLFTPGRILHIAVRKKTKSERYFLIFYNSLTNNIRKDTFK